MKTKTFRLLAAVLIFIVPFVARSLWFYRGTYHRAEAVATPDYQALEVSQPVLSTPSAMTVSQASISKANIIFDFSHGNYYNISDIDPMTSFLTNLGVSFSLSDSSLMLEAQLKNATAYVVIAPTLTFARYEVQAIEKFVERGGKLLVIADPTRNIDPYTAYYYSSTSVTTSVDVVNLLLANYRITFSEDYLYNVVHNEGNFRNIIFNDFTSSTVTEGLDEVVFYGTHSIRSEGEALITGDADTVSSITDKDGSLSPVVSSGDGVLALGDLSFMTFPYNQVSDNQKLIENIVKFLLQGTTQPSLATIPYLFTHPITIYQDPGSVVDNTMLKTYATVQRTLKNLNYSYTLSNEVDKGNDVILLALYPPSKDIQPFLEKYEIEFSNEVIPTQIPITEKKATPTAYASLNDSYGNSWYAQPTQIPNQDVITIPDLGKFPTNGTGIILFSSNEDQNVLVLMAASTDALSELTALIFSDYPDLTSCWIKDDMAACRLYTVSSTTTDYSYDYSNYNYNYDYSYLTQEPALTETPYIPELTPTPSG